MRNFSGVGFKRLALATAPQHPDQLRLQAEQARLCLALLRRLPSLDYDHPITNWTFLWP